MRPAIIILIILLATGCALSRREKFMLGNMVVYNVADVITTRHIIRNGGYETNSPYYGYRPSTVKMVSVKTVLVLGLWGLGEIWPENRSYFYGLGTGVGAAATGWNLYQMEKE